MEPKEKPDILDLFSASLKQEAQIKALRKTVVELMMRVTGQPFDVCANALVELERTEHQKLLEFVEEYSPALAAEVDRRGQEHLPPC